MIYVIILILILISTAYKKLYLDFGFSGKKLLSRFLKVPIGIVRVNIMARDN